MFHDALQCSETGFVVLLAALCFCFLLILLMLELRIALGGAFFFKPLLLLFVSTRVSGLSTQME